MTSLGEGPESGSGSLYEALEATGLGEKLCRDAAAASRTLTPILMQYADPDLAVQAVTKATPAAKKAILAYLQDLLGGDNFGGFRE
jgi:hypothetical protein